MLQIIILLCSKPPFLNLSLLQVLSFHKLGFEKWKSLELLCGQILIFGTNVSTFIQNILNNVS